MKENSGIGTSGAPRISIILAAYNEERTIGRAIESIQAQTFKDWELIVVNDGSVDATEKIVLQYADNDERIRLITNSRNMKLPASLNKGIELARADLIARADADDINHPDRLSKQFVFMQENPDVDVLGTGAWLLDSSGNRINAVALPEGHDDLSRLPFLKTHFFHSSVLVRRHFFSRVGMYDVRYQRAQDKELWLRGLRARCRYGNLPEPLIDYATADYIRSFRSILSNTNSLLRMVREYGIERGYLKVALFFAYSLAIKANIYKPKSFR